MPSGIYSIVRDWGDAPCIVRIQSYDSLSLVGSLNYILNQAANIAAANEGAFSWQSSDVVLVYASDGWSLFSIAANLLSLNLIGSGVQQISIPLTAAQIQGMYAAPVFVLAAPAAGTINLVQSAVLNIAYGSAAFAAGGVIALQYKNTADGAGVPASSTVAASVLNGVGANESILFGPPATIVSANAVGQAIYLSNQTQPFTGGTADTAVLNVLYRNVAAS